MLSGTHLGKNISSGGSSGRSSHFHQPKRASQIRVNTRLAAIPPCSLTHPAARAMCGSSGRSPARRRATYASMVAERSPGPPWKVAQVPSPSCSPRMKRPAARTVAGSWIPRNCRSRRSSASMVTLVARSPFHQPCSSCLPRRCSTERSAARRAAASTSSAAIVDSVVGILAEAARGFTAPVLPSVVAVMASPSCSGSSAVLGSPSAGAHDGHRPATASHIEGMVIISFVRRRSPRAP